MKTAIGYIRVSTEEQATEGVSLDAQREKIGAYCQLHEIELLEVFADEGRSGKRADNRPGLSSALDAACRFKSVLVVHNLSRLARNTLDAISISVRLEKSRADLASITEKIDTTSSMGRFFFRLMASLGELERDQISDRTRSAMGFKRTRSERISRFIPFGFDLDDDGIRLVENPSEQIVIEMVKNWRDEGWSFRRIADELERRGVPSKRAGRWHAKVVWSLLRRS